MVVRVSSATRGHDGKAEAFDRHHRLRSFPRLSPRHRAGRRHRAHLVDARASRDLRALHVQSRMGRGRIVVREIHGASDAQGFRHHRAAGGVLAAVSLLIVLREQEQQDQNREGPQRQDRRLAGMGAYGRRLHARLAQRRARRQIAGRALVSGRRQRSRTDREGRAQSAQGRQAHARRRQIIEPDAGRGRDRLRADRAPAGLLPAGPQGCGRGCFPNSGRWRRNIT